jgi:undecaprenyl diphosphate synthase
MANQKTREKLPQVPQHIAIIMDGNGRWAEKRFLPRLAGHQAGTENLREIIKACVEFGVKYLTVYAFSTENWKRSPDEVSGLLKILAESLEKELGELHKQGVQLRHIGRLERLNVELSQKIRKAIEITKNNQRLILSIAWNYGGRDEIVYAVEQIIREGIKSNEVDEGTISGHLFTANLPDPDLVIRTSGEMRTSNFLPWQTAYSEWYFTPILWPDFKKPELEKAIQAYNERERRFGGRIPIQSNHA